MTVMTERLDATRQGSGEENGMFLKNVWYVAGWLTEFEPGELAARTIAGEPVVFFRKQNGTLYALPDRCPHRWAPLSKGRLEGDDLRCMYHGVKFDADGNCVEVPAQENFSPQLCLQPYPVVERHQWAWLWLGDPALADASMIPDCSYLDDPVRRFKTGQLDYEAHHALISDNLLDLSHVGFLHEKTLAAPPEGEPEDKKTGQSAGGSAGKRIETGVRYENWRVGDFGRAVIQAKSGGTGDVWSRLDYVVPGVFISRVATYPAGTAEACDFGTPPTDVEPLSDNISCQAVTPMTERSTRYFFSSGPRKVDVTDEEAEGMWKVASAAFDEDLDMIEAQQKIIDNHPARRMAWIDADRGPAMFRQVMADLMRKEGTPVDAFPPGQKAAGSETADQHGMVEAAE